MLLGFLLHRTSMMNQAEAIQFNIVQVPTIRGRRRNAWAGPPHARTLAKVKAQAEAEK